MKRQCCLYRFALLCLFFAFSCKALAMPFRCDKDQNLCEVQTKRLTIGDKIGVFAPDGQLAAIGEVVEIRGKNRLVKITRRWADLYRSYEMEVIEDEKAKAPEKYFRVITPLPQLAWGVSLSGLNIGIGDGFTGTGFEGTLYYLLWRNMLATGRMHYLSGSGKASDNLGGAPAQDVSITSIGASIGLSFLLAPYEVIALRFDGDLGVSNASVTLSGNFDKSAVLNKRIDDGVGLYARLGATALLRRDGIQPELGFQFIRLHQSNAPGLFIGLSAPID